MDASLNAARGATAAAPEAVSDMGGSQATKVWVKVIFALRSDTPSGRGIQTRISRAVRSAYALNESPHEQVPVALGLLMRKPRRSSPDS